MTALARTSSNRQRQTRPLIKESSPHQQTHKSLTVLKTWPWAPDGCLTPRETGRQTVGRNVILILTLTEFSRKGDTTQRGLEDGCRGIATVRAVTGQLLVKTLQTGKI
jgi:hypothetical protein